MSLSEEEEDAYHRTQDQKVIENIGDFDPSKRSMLPTALAMVCQEEDRLDPKFGLVRNTRDLLGNEPDLKVALEKAWIKKEFKDIRNRDILRLPSQIRETKGKSQSHKGGHIAELDKMVKSAWNKEYTGKMHILLLDNLNIINYSSIYSGFASIVQSSGTGKSRMVHEQAKFVFTIPFNLRNEGYESFVKPYPEPDNNVRQFLIGFKEVSTAKINIIVFLGKIYDLASKRLSSLLNDSRMKRQEIAERWHNYLQVEGIRSALYQDALDATKEYLHSDPGGDVVQETRNRFTELLKTIKEHTADEAPDDNHVKVILYFDDAQRLIPSPDRWKPQINVLETLQSCLAGMYTRSIFVLFLSTVVSKLREYAPILHLPNSARSRGPGLLQAPITEVPFDCWPGFPICPHLYKLDDLSKIRFMARFGRPLYWALLDESFPESEEIMLDLIRAKVVGRSAPERLPSVGEQPKEIIILLDVRLLLDYELYRHTSVHHEANLVARHMRMNYSVPETRDYLRSSYASEPILAEAAARNLEMYSEDFTVILKALENGFKMGLLDKGAMGELVARLLLVFVHDRAIRNSYSKPLNYSQGVRLIDFLKALFSGAWMNEIMRCTPDNVSSEVTLKDMFKESYVRFTYFGKMVDDTGTTTEAMYAAFLRGMAVITRDNQQGVDIMIPILMWDKELCEYVMTAILIQVKRRICAGSINTYSINQRDINLFPDDCISKQVQNDVRSNPYFEFTLERPRENSGEPVRPYISLILELGVQPKLPRGPGTNPQVCKNLAKKTALGAVQDIDGEDKDVLAKLLRTRDFLADHPRQDSRSLEAVRRMKPFWSAGEPSHHWLESDLLNPKNAMDVDEEDQLAGFVIAGSMEDTHVSTSDNVFDLDVET
ncbi:hypothetical protein SERLA73DRAFT_74000 [Serpula lacrymans var. lacrymans S7.3]|uniref:Uncharacterized protein n=1 Tax=Serpula lacrymans var. lacrymans (strain S7.3) TaxID=936435 RepID=F8PXF0_SERL3|nr:hypothetical protein SERLA73DRAFT_74000 [Serpula lacrymans var. lacrymans S7.3]